MGILLLQDLFTGTDLHPPGLTSREVILRADLAVGSLFGGLKSAAP